MNILLMLKIYSGDSFEHQTGHLRVKLTFYNYVGKKKLKCAILRLIFVNLRPKCADLTVQYTELRLKCAE